MTRNPLVWALAVTSSACFQANFSNDTRDGSTDDPEMQLFADAGPDGALDARTSLAPDDAGDAAPHDAATDDATDDADAEGDAATDEGDASATLPPLHASCQLRAPHVLPPPPTLKSSANNAYTSWQDDPDVDACDDFDVFLVSPCDELTSCNDDEVCLRPDPDQPGLCSPAYDETPGVLSWLVTSGGRCSAGVTAAVKRAACCAGFVDCSERAKQPGEDCLTHADCEPGLLCAAGDGWEYGICVCPGVDPSQLSFPHCGKAYVPTPWGAEATPRGEGSCIAGSTDGWVEEVIATGRFETLAAAAHGTSIYVLSSGPHSIDETWLHTRDADGGWDSRLFVARPSSSVGIAFDAHDAMHVAACSDNQLFTGIGALDPAAIDDGCIKLDLAIDADDESVIAYNALGDVTAKLARRVTGTWSDVIVGDEGDNRFAPVLTTDAHGDLHLWYGAGYHAVVRAGLTLYSADLVVEQAEQSDMTEGSASSPLVAYTDPLDMTPSIYVLDITDPQATPETAWTRDEWGYGVEPIEPRIAFTATGEPAIAHRAPSGLRYTTRSSGEWTSVPVVPEANQPEESLELIFDAAGNPHIVYAVDLDETLDQELRHAYRGSCPN